MGVDWPKWLEASSNCVRPARFVPFAPGKNAANLTDTGAVPCRAFAVQCHALPCLSLSCLSFPCLAFLYLFLTGMQALWSLPLKLRGRGVGGPFDRGQASESFAADGGDVQEEEEEEEDVRERGEGWQPRVVWLGHDVTAVNTPPTERR